MVTTNARSSGGVLVGWGPLLLLALLVVGVVGCGQPLSRVGKVLEEG
jgi:hypothetical protein